MTDAFFNVQTSGQTFFGPQVTVDGLAASGNTAPAGSPLVVTVDLGALPIGQQATLYLTLLGFGPTGSSARITNVQLLGPDGNTAPVANDDSYSTSPGQTLKVGTAAGVLANDTDAEDDPLTAQIASQPAGGSVTLKADGSFTYHTQTWLRRHGHLHLSGQRRPSAERAGHGEHLRQQRGCRRQLGADALRYPRDDQRARQRSRFERHVRPQHGHDCDRAGQRQRGGQYGRQHHLHAGHDARQQHLRLHGQGQSRRRVQPGDGHRLRQRAPVAANDSALTRSDTPVTIDVLGNDSDVDGSLDTSSVAIVSAPSSGSAVVNPNGTITYTPGATLGNNTFTYTVKDNLGTVSNTATVTVFVNAPPVAVNDFGSDPVGQGRDD